MYYMYKKFHKKLQQLRERLNFCKEMHEFKAGSVRPKKASGLHLFFIVFIAVKYYVLI